MNCLFESLEGRRLMSTTPMLNVSLDSAGVLTINNSNQVNVQEFPGNGSTIPTSVVVTSPQIAIYTGSSDNSGTYLGVTKIVINGTNDNDAISVLDTDIPAAINTGNGRDTITLISSAPASIFASSLATVTIDSGNQDDTIILVADPDHPGSVVAIVNGGNGSDIVDVSGPIGYTINTSRGNDILIIES